MFSSKIKNTNASYRAAFTIVELLIVIAVIAILAAIAVVAFTGVQDNAETAVLESDLTQAARQLALNKAVDGVFPGDESDPNDHLNASTGVSYQYTSAGSTFCLTATRGDKSRHITHNGKPGEGTCEDHTPPNQGGDVSDTIVTDGSHMQAITSANCPTERTRAVDARDNRTYWVQKLSDDKCWMLTNLAYAGGGSNNYGDVKPLSHNAASVNSFTQPTYYTVPNTTNFTIEPANPSTATNGTGQHGYLYNWCAAMGGQPGACINGTTPTPNPATTICPAGWRLPTASSGGDYDALNSAVNRGVTNSDAGLRSEWLAQYGGYVGSGFSSQDTNAYYWTSDYRSASNADGIRLRNNRVFMPHVGTKSLGFAVRCLKA